MSALPTGTVTFLFTDIEGSTQSWQRQPDAMKAALARQREIVQQAIEAHAGYVFQIVGDAFYAAFATALDGIQAAIAAQRALHAEPWGEAPMKVRMALHTGVAEAQADDYTAGQYQSGLTLSRAARLSSAAHGGQIILSTTMQELARDHLPEGVTLRDLGEYRLKDLIRPEHIFQVVVPDLPAHFPPLKSFKTRRDNLPVPLSSFIGREREIAELKRLLSTARLVTLTGAGGCGKTRLALEVCRDVAVQRLYATGMYWVELAPLADPALVPQAVVKSLSIVEQPNRALIDTLLDFLDEKQILLVLDNCEHLTDACAQLATMLLQHGPDLRLLATSREALNIAGEVTWIVPSLQLPNPNLQFPTIRRRSLVRRTHLRRAIRLHAD